MESKVNKVKENISQKLELPRDIILDLPKITVMGDNEIIIENHKGVILFDEKQVKINSGVGLISINGSNFEILFMGGSTLILSGGFRSIIYEGNEKN